MVFGIKYSTSLIELKIGSGDIGPNWLVSRVPTSRLGTHMTIIVSNKFANLLTCEYVSKLSRCKLPVAVCVCDEMSVGDYNVNSKCDNIKLVPYFLE